MTVTILDEATEGELLALPDNEPEVLAIGDKLLRELADCRAERQANNDAEDVEVKRLYAAYEELDLPLERREARLLAMLEQVAQALPLRGKKSRALPFGTIGWREQPKRLVVEDEKALMDWVRLMPDMNVAAALVREVRTVKVNKEALDAYCLEMQPAQPVIPAGCTLQEGGDKFFARPSEPHA